MDENPDQIEQRIEAERQQLTQNLHQLEAKVKDATDWRTQVREHPMLLMGAAFGFGMLVSLATGKSRSRDPLAG